MSGFGGFSQGLFGGIGSVFQLYGMYQGIQQTSAQMEGAAQVKEAMEGDQGLYQEGKHPAAQDMSSTATYGGPDTPDPTSTKKEVDTSKIADAPKAPAIKTLTGADLPAPQAPPPVSDADFATGRANPMATPPANIDRNGIATTTPSQPALTSEQQRGIAPLPVVKPIVTYDPSQADTPLARGVLPQPTTSPARAISPTQMATQDIPPGGYPTAAPTAVAAQPQSQPVSPPAPTPALQPPQASAPLPAAPVPQGPPEGPPPGPQAAAQPAQPPGAISRILSALNPIGSAQAAETAPAAPATVKGLPVAQQDTPLTPAEQQEASRRRGQSNEEWLTEQDRQGKPAATPAAGQTGITPATPPKPADTQPAPTQAGPVEVATAGKTGTVAPGQTTPSVQSESQPQVIKPKLWTRPYDVLREQRPDLADMVTRIADEHHVSPYRLAQHWYAESRLKTTSPVSYKGARGPMQVIDDTRKNVDPRGIYDPEKLEDSLHLGALVIYGADQKYGKDSMGSFLAYQGGEGSANAAARNLEEFKTTHPQGWAYLKDNFPGQEVTQNMFTHFGDAGDPARLVAAANGGPDAVLREIVTSGPQGMGMTDLWRRAQTTLVYAAAMKGDYAGIQHAQDFIYQMSHQGALANMAAAHQALMSGDVTGAASALAKAHAFFPDNSFGRFGVGGDGKLYGERFDEATGKPVGKRFEVTKEGLLYQMMSAHDPKEYVKQVQTQQKLVEDARYHDLTIGKDLAIAGQVSADKGLDRGQRRDASELASETTLSAAALRAGGRAPAGQTQELHTIGTDATKRYGSESPDTPENNAKLSPIYADLRRKAVLAGKNMPDAQADSLAKRLTQGPAGGLRMRDNNDGTTGVYEKNSDTPIGHIDSGLARTLAGNKPVAQQGALNVSPIGSQPSAQQQPRAYV